jgi:hypothetical protein
MVGETGGSFREKQITGRSGGTWFSTFVWRGRLDISRSAVDDPAPLVARQIRLDRFDGLVWTRLNAGLILDHSWPDFGPGVFALVNRHNL